VTQRGARDEAHARLAGTVRSDAGGRFELRTIRPGGYRKPVHLGDRELKIPAHIHLDLAAPGRPERRLQAVFADDPLLADPYWKEWVGRLGQPVLEVRLDGGLQVATLVVRMDDR
jgi:protocatechuate 3,4-dioxygenase beta subunit